MKCASQTLQEIQSEKTYLQLLYHGLKDENYLFC